MLRSQQLLGETTEIAYGVHLCERPPWGWSDLAKEISRHVGGTVMPQLARGGLIWQMGSITAGRLIFVDNLPPIKKVQRLCRYLIGDAIEDDLPWSIGGGANRILKWVTPPQKWVPQYGRAFLSDQFGARTYQYHDCQPGTYEYVYQWDAKAYYWNILNLLPSLYVYPTSNPNRPLVFGYMEDDAVARWREAIGLMVPGKDGAFGSIYKSLWGTMLGSNPNNPQIQYVRGVLKKPHFRPGVLRPAALLIARAGAELCHLCAREVGSVYSTVDCVTSLSPDRPGTWLAHGLPCECKYEGDADIRGWGNWRIGPKMTIPYQRGDQGGTGYVERRDSLPNVLYFTSFL